MPRYFISTDDHVEVMDGEGVELPDREALKDLLRRTLTAIFRDKGEMTGVNEFTAKAFDERGSLVMQARVSFSITDQ